MQSSNEKLNEEINSKKNIFNKIPKIVINASYSSQMNLKTEENPPKKKIKIYLGKKKILKT